MSSASAVRASTPYLRLALARRSVSDVLHELRLRLIGHDPLIADLVDELDGAVEARLHELGEQNAAVADANVRALEIAEKQRELSESLAEQNAQLASQSAKIEAAHAELQRQLGALAEANVDAVLRIDDARIQISALESGRSELERTNAALVLRSAALTVEAEALARSNVEAASLIDEREQLARAMSDRTVAAERANVELERLAYSDSLTGVFNHRYFQQRLHAEVTRAHGEGRALSLVFIDVDRFKKLNDTYGHPVGDLVLRALGQLLRLTTRQTDTTARGQSPATAARYGGEEFVVILPDATGEGAMAVAERIRRAVASLEVHCGLAEPLRGVTVSAGIAELEASLDSAELIRRADAALYRAKTGGRNRVELARRSETGDKDVGLCRR